ncbi:hypothetical protein BX661DRAFT_82605 [Kickxella alabastrina]|uniref:uncharacterized protein n=1 Tax=Kickxella alabastrina TaxID=61397 RepID=UPI002220A954|nr:uncharacterized protein BX661DRAFT_82605 [Kickxella alabastrina]KAI7833107.1 hypothetical protein BX661DRAFT_82605 [Kickxella alabastrina]
MRHNSPATQLALVATTLLLTTAIRCLLNNYLLQITPANTNLTYTQNLTTGILTSLSSIIAIPLTNLVGPRPIFLFYTLTNTLYAGSIIILYQYNTHIYYKIANILNIMGNEFARVVTFGLVLAYPAEKWKARTLVGFLILEYFSVTVGDIIIIRNIETSEFERFHAAISFLCITSLAPLPVLAMRPSSGSVVRSNGVHLVTRKTTAWREVAQTLGIFTNRHTVGRPPHLRALRPIHPRVFLRFNWDIRSLAYSQIQFDRTQSSVATGNSSTVYHGCSPVPAVQCTNVFVFFCRRYFQLY